MTSVEEDLRAWLDGATRVVVAGIGNAIRSDDFVGVKIVEGLEGRVSDAVHLIECETVPESFVDEIVDLGPSHVLLIDAAALGRHPGTAGLYAPEEVSGVPAISSHALPIRVFSLYVQEMTGARIALLLIEPGRTDFGEGLTPEVDKSARGLESVLLGALP